MKSIKRKALVIVTAGMLVAGSMSTAVMAHGNGHRADWCANDRVCSSEDCTNDDCETHTLCDKGLLCQNTAECEDCGETYCHDHEDSQHVNHKNHSQGHGKAHHTETDKSTQGKHHKGHHSTRM